MKTEKDLDNLFKQGLDGTGNYKDYREDDWDDLEAMLDKRKKRSIVAFWLPLATGIAALLLLVLGWLFINPSAKDKNNGNNITHVVKPAPQIQKNNAQTNTDNNNIAQVTSPVKNNTGTNGRVMELQVAPAAKVNQGSMQSVAMQGTHKASAAMQGVNSRLLVNPPAIESGSNKGLTDNNTIVAVQTAPTETLAAVNEQVFSPATLNTAVALNGELNLPVRISGPATRKNFIGFRPRMAVTVLASSNLNGVKTFSDSEVGANAGLLFSIGVSKKLTVSTGAIYAKTPYSTAFNNYHSAYKFIAPPESVSADCRVLDVPLNIDYQLYAKAKNSFSIGTGLSSYFMLSEKYHYNYVGPYTYGGPVDVSFTNKNRHIMGVLNLDATYQRQLSPKLGLALQPYLKLPLTDIGNGQVSLQSTGVSVGLSWNINSLSKH